MPRFPGSILDMTVIEKLHQLGRYGHGPESIANRIIPETLRMHSPPQPYCVIRDRETGEVRSGCSPERAAAHYAHMPDVSIEHHRPSSYHVGLWRWNQARVAEITVIWQEQAEANLIHYKDEETLHGIDRALADAMGSTRWRQVSDHEALSYADGFGGGRCKEYLTEAGRVLLDVGVEKGAIYLSQIAVEHTGMGFGGRIMDAVRDYAIENHLDVCIYKTTNPEFFSRFDWLQGCGIGDFNARSSDLKAAAQSSADLTTALRP